MASPRRPSVAAPGRLVPASSRQGRSWRQRGLLAAGTFVSLTLLLAAGAVGYGWYAWHRVERVGVDTDDAPPGDPVNILLVGTDDRAGEGADEEAEVQGKRTDTMMVVRLDPASEEVDVLSIPRDLWVPIAGTGESARINSAYEAPGEEQVLIDTIRDELGIAVNHWVEVDFAGFRSLVDTIGGVTLYFDRALRDRGSGLYVDQLGCVTLDGEMALAYARARKAEYMTEDDWVRDPQSDLSRIVRQQTLMSEALGDVGRQLDNPGRVRELIDIATDNVTIDSELTLGDVRELADRFGNMEDGALHTVSLPVLPRPGDEDSTLVIDEEAAQPVLDVFRGVEPGETPPVRPTDVLVSVRNGTVGDPARTRQGLAGEVTADLEALGFGVGTPGDAEGVHEHTTVRFPVGAQPAGLLVASHLGGEVVLEEDPSLQPGEVTVVVGVGFAGVLDEPRAVDELAEQGTGTATGAADGEDTSPSGSGAPDSTDADPVTDSTEPDSADPDSPDAAESDAATDADATDAGSDSTGAGSGVPATSTTTSPALVGAVPDGAC